MERVDMATVNRVIEEATRGTQFWAHQQKKEARIAFQVAQLHQRRDQLLSARRTFIQTGQSSAPPGLERGEIEERELFGDVEPRVRALERQLAGERQLGRVWVHLDMDAFFASVEELDDPSLREVPMAVGGMQMISTANYPARLYGVRSAMPGFIATRLCPHLRLVRPSYHKYQAASAAVHHTLRSYGSVRSRGLDEASVDITPHLYSRFPHLFASSTTFSSILQLDLDPISQSAMERKERRIEAPDGVDENADDENDDDDDDDDDELMDEGFLATHQPKEGANPSELFRAEERWCELEQVAEAARAVAEEIKARIFQQTRLTCSMGIAPNTRLAKIASEEQKPNGCFSLLPVRLPALLAYVEGLDIRRVSGIGPVFGRLLNSLGVQKCRDIVRMRPLLYLLFPRSFEFLLSAALGFPSASSHVFEEAESDAKPDHGDGIKRRSISVERTFGELSKPGELMAMLSKLCLKMAADLADEGLAAKTVTLKLKKTSFEVISRAKSVSQPVSTFAQLFDLTSELLKQQLPLELRLMGLKCSALSLVSASVSSPHSIKALFSKVADQTSISSPSSTLFSSSSSSSPIQLSSGTNPSPTNLSSSSSSSFSTPVFPSPLQSLPSLIPIPPPPHSAQIWPGCQSSVSAVTSLEEDDPPPAEPSAPVVCPICNASLDHLLTLGINQHIDRHLGEPAPPSPCSVIETQPNALSIRRKRTNPSFPSSPSSSTLWKFFRRE